MIKIVGTLPLMAISQSINAKTPQNVSPNEIARREGVIDKLYAAFDALYQPGNNSVRLLKTRQLLEFAFRFALNPRLNFPPNKNINATTTDTLCQNMTKYYANHDNRFEKVAHQIRVNLNNFIHIYSTNQVNDKQVVDILNKTRSIMNSIFGRNTVAPNIPIQPSIFDVNKEQEVAVTSKWRETLVHAGPGTGKTFLIVDRIIHSLRESGNRKIVGLAFSNEAARNLRSRFEYKIFGTTDFDKYNLVSISTIHSFAFNSLKSYYESDGKEFSYDIIDETEFEKIKTKFNDNKQLINDYIAENNLLTFDMIIETCLNELSKDDHQFAQYIASQVYEIVVDEAQDLTPKDCEILSKIFSASDDLKLFVVGDQRQNIYAFREGSMKNLINAGFVNLKTNHYALKRSYRCPDSVCKFVNGIIFSDCKNHPIENPANPGDDLSLVRTNDETDEIEFIINKIKELKNKPGFAWSDVAVLLSSSYSFEKYAVALNGAQIPFKTFGGKCELKPEIQSFIYLLGAIEKKKYPLQQFFAQMDYDAFPKDASFANLNFAKTKELLEAVDANKPYLELITNYISRSTNKLKDEESPIIEIDFPIGKILKDYIVVSSVDKDVADLLQQFVQIVEQHNISSHTELKQTISPYSNDFEPFYDKPTNIKSEALKDGDNDFVSISTIHSAKGKEWLYVFVPNLTNDLFPRYNRNPSNTNHLIDELKKFYVACTRTKQSLFLSSPISYIVNTYRGPWEKTGQAASMFVEGLPQVQWPTT